MNKENKTGDALLALILLVPMTLFSAFTTLIRHGRFDIQEELDYFNYEEALKCVKLLGYDVNVLNDLNLEYPIQPSYLQGMIMKYRANLLVNGVSE